MTGKSKEKPNDRGFDTFLKPIRDVIAKNWQLQACTALEIYLRYINELRFVNFSEAALIVQNTSHLYCRRVDLMYCFVQEFALGLAQCFEHKENKKETTNNGKKKRHGFSEGEFDSTDLPFTRQKLQANMKAMEGKDKDIDKQVISSTSTIPCRATGASPVLQWNGEEAGLKKQFRIYWSIFYNLQLFFHPCNTESLKFHAERREDEDRNMDDDVGADEIVREAGFERSIAVDVNPPSQLASEPMEVDNIPAVSFQDSFRSDSHSITDIADIDPFLKVAPLSSLTVHKKIKLKKGLSSIKNLLQKGKHTSKKLQKKGIKADCPNSYLSLCEIINGKLENPIDLKLRDRNIERSKMTFMKRKSHKNNYNNDEDPCDDNYEDDEILTGEQFPVNNDDDNNSDNYDQVCEQSAGIMDEFYQSKNEPVRLEEKVAAWHELIGPVLEKAEQRSIFDVHAYGSEIIESFDSIGSEKSFKEIASNKPREEICRYLLSSLMLANTYNVEISKTDPSELSKDCLKLKLISKVRHHEELDTNLGATANT